jgi:enoyl-CoA hydratase/carnithine racemase
MADIGGALGGGALEVAVCCDLVFVRTGAMFQLQPAAQPPSRPLLWALARAGHAALGRGLLDGSAIAAEEAVTIGLADRVVAAGADLPLPDRWSVAALTAARDLVRSRAVGSAGRALELATFKLLFATGDPEEGARAFLERRAPRFENDSGHRDGG